MLKEIEKSLNKTYKKHLWIPFISAIQEFKLVEEDDKIAVCISGGKDSFLLAKLFQELQKHKKVAFQLVFLVINPGYSAENTKHIHSMAKRLGIPVQVYDVNYFQHVSTIEHGSPCYVCARIRRGVLYSYASNLGCNKIALGHHFNDVVETTLMSMLYNGQFKTMMPKLRSKNYPNMQLIRPMCYILEDAIIKWGKKFNLTFINCACPLYEKAKHASKRDEIKGLVKYLDSINNSFSSNIFTSLKNVNLHTIIGYEKEGVKYNFLDNY